MVVCDGTGRCDLDHEGEQSGIDRWGQVVKNLSRLTVRAIYDRTITNSID